ncbi:MAG: DUF3298 domain-containing protein [Actinobacteria bacterium]|nr:DUF3298 domain-containing protein [Actinomycetota bacterium]
MKVLFFPRVRSFGVALLALSVVSSCAGYDGRVLQGGVPSDTLDVLVVDQGGAGVQAGAAGVVPASTKPNVPEVTIEEGLKGEMDWSVGVGGSTKVEVGVLSGEVAAAGSYELSYPQVTETAADFAINGALQAVADRVYLGFAGELAELMGGEDALSEPSRLLGDGEVVFDNDFLLSVLFKGTISWGGAASQQAWAESVMVDLSDGRGLPVVELFTGGPADNWLEVVAERSHELLVEDLGAEMVWDEGLMPVAENFANLLVTRPGLLVIFDQYQVAAGVAGTPAVVVPWIDLVTVINPQSSIGRLVVAG